MMGKRLYKAYADLTNIVLRISDGTPAGKAHALLLNSHVDSTLPSPGAADDALPVGAMIECARVLIQDDEWTPAHAVVFCAFMPPYLNLSLTSVVWNNAEESLQDGSHLFSTQHPIAPTSVASHYPPRITSSLVQYPCGHQPRGCGHHGPGATLPGDVRGDDPCILEGPLPARHRRRDRHVQNRRHAF
jgi:Zn-dependent M28 family amino/carboxypeptidase